MNFKELQLLTTVYQKFNELTKTVLDDECSITLFNNTTGYFDISYKNKNNWRTLQFYNLEFALTILNAIEKYSSISEFLKYLSN